MRLRGVVASLVLCCSILGAAGCQKRQMTSWGGMDLPHVLVRTSVGDIVLAVDSVHAPLTSWNFLKYVDEGYYDNGQFHRTVRLTNQPNNDIRIEVVQASPDSSRKLMPPIPLERTSVTGLSHKNGTVSMARGTSDSATGDFFICINAQPELDFGGRRNADGQGFAAFATVVSGMDVVLKIQASKADGQKLTPPVKIIEARRVKGS